MPGHVRGPDVSFVSRERLESAGVPAGFWNGPPDLAVEIRSPEDRAGEIAEHVRDYLDAGVRLVWVIDPDRQTVTVHRPSAPTIACGPDDTVDGADVVPGFSCRVRAIFE